MRNLPNLGLQAFFDLGEDGWNDEVDLNFLKLSVLTQAGAISKVAATPGAPANGDVHIFDETHPTNANAIAVYDVDAWKYFAPNEGWLVYNRADNNYETFDGATWNVLATGGSGGGGGGGLVYPSGRYWMLMGQSPTNNDVYVGFASLDFREESGGPRLAVAGASAFNGNFGAPGAGVDGNPNTWWAPDVAKSERWFIADLGAVKTVKEIAIQARNDGFFTRTTQRFTLFASDDGKYFRPVGHFDMGAFTANGQVRAATISPQGFAGSGSGGVATPFSGARLKRSDNAAIGGAAALGFTTEDYDYGGWHDNAVNNSRITVPAGVSRIRLTAQLDVQGAGSTSFRFRKNGVNADTYGVTQVGQSGYSFTVLPVGSGVIEVVPGDYFELITEGSGTVIGGPRTFFNVEAISEQINANTITTDVRTVTTAGYVLATADNNNIVEKNVAGDNTITIPANATVTLPIGAAVSIVQVGAGATTVQAAAGVSINGVVGGSATISGRWAGVSLYKRAADAWVIQGDHGGVA